jgi:hypothetical protein
MKNHKKIFWHPKYFGCLGLVLGMGVHFFWVLGFGFGSTPRTQTQYTFFFWWNLWSYVIKIASRFWRGFFLMREIFCEYFLEKIQKNTCKNAVLNLDPKSQPIFLFLKPYCLPFFNIFFNPLPIHCTLWLSFNNLYMCL